jgi:sortase A
VRRFVFATTLAPDNVMNKRLISTALLLLALFGVGMAMLPLAQTAYARWNQHKMMSAWQHSASVRNGGSSPGTRVTQASTRSQNVTAKTTALSRSKIVQSRVARAPLPPTRIVIPEIGLDAVVGQGMEDSTLRRGPAHDASTTLPGQPGNCVIAAHRNVYGSYFYRVDELLPGSKIILRTPREDYTYQVVQTFTVADTDSSIKQAPTDPNSPPLLTLYTCTIPRTTTRIVVTAQLVPDGSQ